jgi:unsaturated chondroitin disaccharide hydrolase
MNLNIKEIYLKLEAKLEAECSRVGDQIPYISENGRYVDMRSRDPYFWTNGFWAGILWQMYHGSGKEIFRAAAEKSEIVMGELLKGYSRLHHDIGFQFLHTAVADYRLTGNEESKVLGLHAANLLAGRFNPAGNFIRAWNDDNGKGLDVDSDNKSGWIIIDCLMNLPLLYWAGEETKDPRFAYIANQHVHTALRTIMREDGSCNHIVILDPETGEVQGIPGGQGYVTGSSWSRGQSWAIYGFALASLHTGRREYLDAAKRAAHYFIASVAADGYVSVADFRAPKEPRIWDTTAAACAACGLLQIAELVPENEKALYYDSGVRMLSALAEKHCDWSLETDGILRDGTVAYWIEDGRQVPIIYGDYFFVEGILRLMGKSFLIW